MPLPVTWPDDTALASGQPSQPPVLVRLFARGGDVDRDTSTEWDRSPTATASVPELVPEPAQAPESAMELVPGRVLVLEPALVPKARRPASCAGIRTMKTSARLPPMFDAHRKYSPVGSMLPFGRFE